MQKNARGFWKEHTPANTKLTHESNAKTSVTHTLRSDPFVLDVVPYVAFVVHRTPNVYVWCKPLHRKTTTKHWCRVQENHNRRRVASAPMFTNTRSRRAVQQNIRACCTSSQSLSSQQLQQQPRTVSSTEFGLFTKFQNRPKVQPLHISDAHIIRQFQTDRETSREIVFHPDENRARCTYALYVCNSGRDCLTAPIITAVVASFEAQQTGSDRQPMAEPKRAMYPIR